MKFVVLLAVKIYTVVLWNKTMYSVTDTYQHLGEPATSTDYEDARFREGCCGTSDGYTSTSGFDPKTMCDLWWTV
jgi:hypothetical protein